MASEYVPDNDKKLLLCKVCYEKDRFSRDARKGFWRKFYQYLIDNGIKKVDRPDDFTDIGECSPRKGYTALVYADGNAMGKLIKEIDTPERFEFFSDTVESSIYEACYEALYEVFFEGKKEEPVFFKLTEQRIKRLRKEGISDIVISKLSTLKDKKYKNENEFVKVLEKILDSNERVSYNSLILKHAEHWSILPAEILLSGGDDLMAYLSADTALPFAIKVAEKFNQFTIEKMKADPRGDFFIKKTGGKGLTISLGIAYGKSHTPFSLLLNQAEELLAIAKKAGSKNGTGFYAPTYIDYHVSTYFNQVSVKDSRKLNLEPPSLRLYQKPYSLEDATAILHHAQELVNADIPSTRLNRLGNAPTLGKVNGILECLKLYTRAKKDKQRPAIWDALGRFGCVRNMPWNEDNPIASTVLVDLIEIVGFCEKNHSEENTDAA